MIERLLKTHLDPIASNYRRWRLWRTLALCWGGVALTGLAVLFLRQTAAAGVLPIAFPLLILSALVAAVVVVRRHFQFRIDHREIARRIEAEDPRLHALLLTAVEQQPEAGKKDLDYLQRRVVAEALAYRQKHLWGQRSSIQLFWAQCAHWSAFALMAAVIWGLRVTVPAGKSFFALRADGVTVTPGDTAVERGSSLVVLVRFDGWVPTEAQLVVRPANEIERRLPLTRNLNDPVFGTSIPDVTEEFTYHVEYGSDQSRDYRVTVFEYPSLERADARLTFPAYTRLPEKTVENTRRVSAVEGTELDYTFHLNKPVASASLVAKDKSSVTLLADTNRPSVYQTRFKLDQNLRYDLVLVDDAGRTNKVPPQFVVEVLKNRAPDLKFAFPRGDQRVSALEEMAFQAEAIDDFGISSYGLAYNLAGQETRFLELGQSGGPNEKRQFTHLLALENLDAHPDQLLSYYLWADDVGPDGEVRRTSSDMFFAEIRPFEEIFREGQSPEGGGGEQSGEGMGGESEKLAELQKQIINATWKLRRQETGKTPSAQYKKDAPVVQEAQEKALEQARELGGNIDDPRSRALVEAVEKEMEKAVVHLSEAVTRTSLEPLPGALAAEQSAYQALLRLAAREYQVSRGQNSRSSGRSGGRAQRQLDQLELKQSENRYETQRQATPEQNSQQREQLQVFNRLKELAQRQNDLNDRLKELQTALQEAKTEQEREEIRRRLKRLREEEQELLADLDELSQRMSRPENQSRMAESRQQLEQTRSEVQQASESMEQGQVSDALSSGTRAQRELQQMRDEFRKQNSSQFAEDMRQLREDARQLSQEEEKIGQELQALSESQRKTLTDSDERKELANRLDEQKKQLEEVLEHARAVTQQAEAAEPLLAERLYDTVRQATQDEAKNIRETTEELLNQGRLLRQVYDKLQSAKDGSKKSVEITADLLREGFTAEARQLEQRARRSLDDLKRGVERAAESVLGDDTEALRLAKRELDDLNRQLEQEIARATGDNAGTNRTGAPSGQDRDGDGRPAEQRSASNEGRTQEGSSTEGNSPESRQGRAAANSESQSQEQRTASAGEQAGASQASQGSPGEANRQPQSQSSGSRAGNGTADTENGGDRNQPGSRNASNQPGRRNFFDQGGGFDGGGTGGWEGPILGAEYTQWSDRLRDVEEMLDTPELRAEAARIRDRARAVRVEARRHSKEPQWDSVKLQIAGPLAELRTRVAEELARRESNDAIVPLDRDPVPTRYSELVRRYYEQLGRSEP